ncbi:MAG: GDSL-type esterase/lipase family protein, partial [Eubacterium sp.]
MENKNKITALLSSFFVLIGFLSFFLITQNISLQTPDEVSEPSSTHQVMIEEITHSQNVAESSDAEEETTSSPALNEEDSEFENSLFIGDSRMEGFYMHSGITTGTFYVKKGLSLSKIYDEKFIKIKGRYKTIFGAMENQNFDKVFIMLGLNELGWPYIDTFQERYSDFVANIKNSQPDAEIYILSILHVSEEKSSEDDIYNNKNVNKFNKAIKKMC